MAAVMVLLALQTVTPQQLPASPAPAVPTAAVAARAERPPVIDGRGDEPAWEAAELITAFREWQPRENAPPRFPTEARILYDPLNLYVLVRAHDPHPDSIITMLARRDRFPPTDRVILLIDSYHDRRTAYEFGVNPSGSKFDAYMTGDGNNEDDAWDAVWDVATSVDSAGWTAEFRIPLSQMRYTPGPENTFGILILRDIQRTTERLSWPTLYRSRAGAISQGGELRGLVGLASPRRLELAPYAVTKNHSRPLAGGGFGREQDVALGADVKYGITSNLTLDGTVNPDFGQVEADPARVNLSAFELQFQERRPFFIEGSQLFRFGINCSAVNCGGESMFYSRRIGRAPQLGGRYGEAGSPTATRILGAAKVTGRLPGGLTIGVLDAVTEHERGRADTTIEPLTNYTVVRLQQDLRGGESGVGVVATGVERRLDAVSDPVLRDGAYAAAADFRHRFLGRRYEVAGSVAVSRVSGSREAITATQLSPVHLFQRPDDGIAVDSSLTVLTGDLEELRLGKVGGGWLRFESSYLRRSRGFEVNDIGFMRRADEQSWNNWMGIRGNNPRGFYQQANLNLNWWQYWTSHGLPTERAFNTNVHVQLNNRMWVHAGGTLGQLGETYCDLGCTRGGPALRHDGYIAPWLGIEGDDRKKIIPYFWMNYYRGDGGRSRSINISPEITLRPAAQFSAELDFGITWNRDDRQPLGPQTDAANPTIVHYRFAHLEQTEASISARLEYTATPTLSVQAYIQPFISKGTFSDVRELANPRAARYEDRFQPYAETPGGFNTKAFNSNFVVRWEYRPGSTLFFVWTQRRFGELGAEGSRTVARNFGDLLDTRPDNTLLVKASYWFSW